MGVTCLLCAILLTPGAPETAGDDPNGDRGVLGGEPEGGAGVSPIEIVPRIELKQSYVRLSNGVAVNDTTFDTSFQFTRRLLLQYQMPYRGALHTGRADERGW